jgi:hypothetical protein
MASKFTIDRAAIAQLLTSPTGPVAGDLLRRGRNVEGEAKRLCPVDHGRLRSSITHELGQVRGQLAVRVGTNVSYALHVHEGTGIYGPTGQPITPKRARVLRWNGRDGVVYRPRSKGSRGRPYLRNALPAASR